MEKNAAQMMDAAAHAHEEVAMASKSAMAERAVSPIVLEKHAETITAVEDGAKVIARKAIMNA